MIWDSKMVLEILRNNFGTCEGLLLCIEGCTGTSPVLLLNTGTFVCPHLMPINRITCCCFFF